MSVVRSLRSAGGPRGDEGCVAVVLTFFLLVPCVMLVAFALRPFPAFMAPVGGNTYRMTTLGLWVGLGLSITLAMLPGMVLVLRARRQARALRRREAGGAMVPEAEEAASALKPGPPAPTGARAIVLRAWGGALLAMGVAVTVKVIDFGTTRLGPSWREARASRHWPVVDGVIVTSLIESRVVSDVWVQVRPRIRYRYTAADGREYVGARLSFDADTAWRRRPAPSARSGGDPSPEEVRLARRVVQEYPVGRRVRVSHHPDNPAHSALEPGWSVKLLLATSALLVGIPMGFGLVWVGWKLLRRT